jgi:hypothetical protein
MLFVIVARIPPGPVSQSLVFGIACGSLWMESVPSSGLIFGSVSCLVLFQKT